MKDKNVPEYKTFNPVTKSDADAAFKDMIDMYNRGREIPLPFAPETSAAYYGSLYKSGALPTPSDEQIMEAEQAAEGKWSNGFGRTELEDESMFHAFGEPGPLYADDDINPDFREYSEKFFEPFFVSKPVKTKTKKGAK